MSDLHLNKLGYMVLPNNVKSSQPVYVRPAHVIGLEPGANDEHPETVIFLAGGQCVTVAALSADIMALIKEAHTWPGGPR